MPPSPPGTPLPGSTPRPGSPVSPSSLTGMSSAEELSIPTDISTDFRTHKFLDLNRPMLMQVWNGGFSKEFYLQQVHRPRHYKGGESAQLFGNFLEPLSKTPWYLVPIIWLPVGSYGIWIANNELQNWGLVSALFVLGLLLWTLVEYGLHRCLFHLDGYVNPHQYHFSLLISFCLRIRIMPDSRVSITLHFLLHGIHHFLPMDKLRLVMPPALFLALATPFWFLAHIMFWFNWYVATNVFCGGIYGYVCYDLTHYFLHHKS